MALEMAQEMVSEIAYQMESKSNKEREREFRREFERQVESNEQSEQLSELQGALEQERRLENRSEQNHDQHNAQQHNLQQHEMQHHNLQQHNLPQLGYNGSEQRGLSQSHNHQSLHGLQSSHNHQTFDPALSSIPPRSENEIANNLVNFIANQENVNAIINEARNEKEQINTEDASTEKYLRTCPYCPQTFDNETNFKNHRSSHAINPKSFKCSLCPKAYTRRQGLVYHQNSIHMNGHIPTQHSDENKVTRVFHCSGHKCPKTFTTRFQLDEHLKIDHNINEPKFSEKSVYHNRQRMYTCAECHKTFVFPRDWIRHLRTHSDERPFQCPDCPSAFKQKSHLTTHRRKHTGERPFKCSECPAGFIQQQSLIVHMRTHTGEKPFECDYCKKNFTSSAILKTHVFMMHRDNRLDGVVNRI